MTSGRRPLRHLLALAALLSATPTFADTISVAGHRVETGENADLMQTLVVDGQVILEGGAVFLDGAVELAGGGAFVAGAAGAGGNACAPVPFVLLLPADGPPRLDQRPGDSCDYFTPEVGQDRVTYTKAATAAWAGERWIWTAGKGFSGPEPIAFAPDRSKGWDDLDGLDNAHPVEVFAYGEIYDQMMALLGETETDSFLQVISGLGSGSLTGPGYVGQACDKFDCAATYGVLILDAATRQPYLAWTLGGGEMMTRPALADWSPAAAQALADWSAAQ